MTAPSTPKPPRKKPKTAATAKPVVPRKEATLHPRNRHTGRYDFPALIKTTPELAKFVIINPYGKESIDFASPDAVRVFNRALLKSFYGIQHWDIPADYLCPPVPGRADYVHFLADLLASNNDGKVPRGSIVKVLDIGMGANCVYPLIGYMEYRWNFLGSEVDPIAVAAAKAIVQSNDLSKVIQLRQQTNPKQILLGLLEPGERFDLTMCNPPFHASMDEATKGSERKWRALGKADPKRKLPVLNFGGQSAELWCEGGEARFHAGVESVEFARDRDGTEKGRGVGKPSSGNVPRAETKPLRGLDVPDQERAADLAPALGSRLNPARSYKSQATKNRARIAPEHGFFCCVLLVNSVGQAFGHNQLDNFLGSDFDGSASRRVTASTGRTLGHFQFANAWQSDFAAVFQLIGNNLAQLVQQGAHGSFRCVYCFSQVSDQLVFSNSHCGVPSLSNSYGLQSAVSAVEPDRHGLAPPAITTEIGVIDA
ncbi:hypothetical protein BHE74_00007146 [Ensete ventricosum]|nr:hypothetical protein BHE74_00007146 [Ensete ventricosum]